MYRNKTLSFSLIERIWSFFMDFIKNTAQVIKNGASEAKSKISAAYRKSALQGELEEMYETLGKIRYSEIVNKTSAEEETRKISEEISRLQKELHDIEQNISIICGNCGEKVNSGCSFCPHCGEKLS